MHDHGYTGNDGLDTSLVFCKSGNVWQIAAEIKQ